MRARARVWCGGSCGGDGLCGWVGGNGGSVICVAMGRVLASAITCVCWFRNDGGID